MTEVKIDNIFEMSIQNWVDSYVFQIFSSTFVFLKKIGWGPPQGLVKKWVQAKSHLNTVKQIMGL